MIEASILLVVNDEILALHLRDLLTRRGYKVLEPVTTGEEAIGVVESQKPSLILMDIELKGKMSGITAAEKISSVTDTPIIFLTGSSQDPLLQQAKIAAPFGYLIKPVPERELAMTIDLALYKHELDYRIKESEARYRSLVEQVSDGIFLSDSKGNYIEVNNAGCAMLGYTREEILQLNMRDLIPPDDLDTAPLRISDLQHGATLRTERRLRRKDGSCFPIEISAKMLEDGSLQWIVRDITERKLAEKVLEMSEQRYRNLFDNISSGVAIYEVIGNGEDFVFKDINKSGERLDGEKKENIIGKSVLEVHPGIQKFGLLDVFKRVWEKGFPEHHPASLYQDQKLVKWYENYVYRLPSGEIVAIYDDITERKQAVEALRESEARFRRLANNAPDILFRYDLVPVLRLAYINNAIQDITGYSPEECYADPDLILHMAHPDDAALIAKLMQAHILPDKPLEMRWIGKDGQARWMESRIVPVRDEFGHLIAIEGITRDVTERKLAEEALRDQESQYRALAENSQDYIMRYNRQHRHIYANAAAIRVSGRPVEEYLGCTHREMGFPDDLCDLWEQSIDRAFATGQVQREEFEWTGAEGRVVLDWRLFPETGQQGQVVSVLGVSRDISEVKRAEKALRESEARFRATIEQSFDGILILDDALCIIEWNKAQTKIFGFARDEMIGKALWEYQFTITPGERKSPQLLKTLKERAQDFGNTGIYLNPDALQTMEVEAKDGRRKIIQVSFFPIEVSGNKLYCSISRDITSERSAEQNYQILFREMLDGLALHEIILDHDGNPVDYRFLMVNPAFERLTGLKEADIKGRTVLEVMPGTEPYWIEIYGQVALTGKPAFFENYARELDKFFKVTVFRPAPNQFTTIFEDITERKRTEMALKSAYTKLEALWGIASIAEANIKIISEHVLATITKMTGSDYGFYGFVDQDESIMTIHSWTGKAMNDCSIVDKPQHFHKDEAGIWAEAIRRKEPFILNNYNDAHGAKKGLPEGHVALTNLLVVPHFSQGKITAVVAVANRPEDYNSDDITQINTFLTSIQALIDSKLAEEALHESEDKFRYVFDHSVIGKSLTMLSGEIRVNNAFCEMLGYTHEEIENKSWQDITHPEDIELSEKALEPLLRGEKETLRFSKRYLHKSGNVVWADVSTSLRRDATGEPLYFVTAVIDITERKRQESKLNEQLEELRRWHRITLGREDRILELKSEVNRLLAEIGRPARYASAKEEIAHE